MQTQSPPPAFWICPRLWPGETAFVVGGGPSLRGWSGDCLRGRRVVAIKESCLLVPFAEFMFFCDDIFVERERPLIQAFAGMVVTTAKRGRNTKAKVMRRGDVKGISTSPDTLNGGYTAVHFAMNLCRHLGAARIVLLGVDLGYADPAQARWHDRNPKASRPGNYPLMYDAFKSCVAPLAAMGIEVVNCTAGGGLDLWPRRKLEELLAETPAPAPISFGGGLMEPAYG